MSQKPRAATQGGVKGHIVHVSGYDKFVRNTYPGNDPRTKAARRNR